jgi:hypothetical protein
MGELGDGAVGGRKREGIAHGEGRDKIEKVRRMCGHGLRYFPCQPGVRAREDVGEIGVPAISLSRCLLPLDGPPAFSYANHPWECHSVGRYCLLWSLRSFFE